MFFCLFSAVAWNLLKNERLEEKLTKKLKVSLENTFGTDPSNFQVIYTANIASVKDNVEKDFLLFDTDFVDGEMIDELASRVSGKQSNIVRLLPYNSHNCSVSNVNGLFKIYRGPSCHLVNNRPPNAESHLTACQ